MKTLFIFREGLESKYILSELLNNNPNSCVIVETGKKARINKINRTFKKASVFYWPVEAVNILAVFAYGKLYERYLSNKFTPKSTKTFSTVEDVNDDKCISDVLRIKPDVIVIFGTSIIRKPFFQKIKAPIFNIHTGILPKYRNVHSDFWAFKNKDFKNIGVTIIHVDTGIDSGAIALKQTINYKNADSLFDVKLKNLKLIPKMVEKLLNLYTIKKVPFHKQEVASSSFYHTPSFYDLVSFVLAK